MQNSLKCLAILISVFLCFSCSSSSSENDSNSAPDADADTQDSETQDEDSDTQEAETVDDSDVLPDADQNNISDSDSDESCPPLSEAKFPYYDANGKITFCRPGCDTPTDDDPICIGNLWDEQNEKLCHEYPEYACCGTPCILESLKPMTKEEVDEMYTTKLPMHKCDLKISPWSWVNDGSHGVVKAWNMSEEKVGFYTYPVGISYEQWPVKTKFVTYNIATQKYSLVIPARGQEQAYYKGKRLALIADTRSLDLNNSNIFLAYIGDDAKVEIVYDRKVKSISYEPALNEKWAFVNLVDSNGKRMLYAKVGEWKWTSLGDSVANHTSLADNYLGIYDDNKNGYICDLSKNPKSFSECMKINRENEKVSIIRFNQDNPNEFIFNLNGIGITKARIENGKIVDYNTIISDFTTETADNAYTLSPYQFKDNLILYVEITYKDGVGSGGQLCYYRLDKNKKYCMKKMEKDETYSDGTTIFPYGFSEFEGKWLLYQKINSTPLILRDMECYCKEENVCPFEDDDEENSTRKPLQIMQKLPDIKTKIEQLVKESKTLPEFDKNKVYFCLFDERSLNELDVFGYCPTAEQTNEYLKLSYKSSERLKDLFLGSKSHWKSEKSFADLVKNHKKHWNNRHGCDWTKNSFVCEYDEETSTFDSDSVMFATVIDHGRARDGIFFRDKFYETNGNFTKVIKELRQKFGASLRGNPRIEVKLKKDI